MSKKPKPKDRSLGNLLRWAWQSNLDWLRNVAVIVGVPLFFLKLYSDGNVQQVERSLQFAKRFDEQRLATERENLLKPWLAYGNVTGSLSRTALDTLVKKLVEQSSQKTSGRDLRLSVLEMAGFFDQLHACIHETVCDEETALQFFKGYARKFYCLYGVVIKDFQSSLNDPTFGTGVRKIAGEDPCN